MRLENGSFVTLIGLDFGLFWAAKDVVFRARAYLFMIFLAGELNDEKIVLFS